MFSLDPTHSRLTGATTVLSVPWEPLRPGPAGSRIRVMDDRPDGTNAGLLDLDDPDLLAQDGLAPDESDPLFRQQMVYAVIASLLETLDQARGRHLVWRNIWRDSPDGPRVRPLAVFPHRIRGANAFYAPGEGLSFGSFEARADPEAPLFPGQWVHGCLSHDIVNHEAGHAFLHELRPMSLQPTGLDALAFHEGFADILAILQHFRLPGLLESQVAQSGTAIWQPGPFVQLAAEFGQGSGKKEAVRVALDDAQAPAPYTRFTEPHDRGAVLVAALFEAFFATYVLRITPILRVAGYSSATTATTLPGEMIALVCDQARAAATTVLNMTVRALDYLPPVDIQFGDFLEAVVLADTDLHPDDRFGFRRSFVEACRRRAIYATSRQEAELDRRESIVAKLEPLPTQQALVLATHDLGDEHVTDPSRARAGGQLNRWWRAELLEWGQRNAEHLGLDKELLRVDGGNASFRWNQDGFPTGVVTVRFTQRNEQVEARMPDRLRGVPLVGGVTLISHADGIVHHAVCKPVPGVGLAGFDALERITSEADPAAQAAFGCLSGAQ
ncbi:MAG: hypothetical protein WCF04_03740 [Candidatus Nanopelagicales bacterium]